MKKPPESAPALLARGDSRGAEKQCRSLLARDPKHHGALHLMGCIQFQKGNPGAALRWIERAIALAPVIPEYHENLAAALHGSGDPERAESECKLALRLDERLAGALNLLGRLAIDRCDYQAAQEHLSASLKAATPNLDAMLNISVLCNRTGEYQLTEKYCRLVLELSPENPLALTNLGLAYKAMRKLEAAKDAFQRAGSFAMARFNLGYTYLLEDDLAMGLPLYEARKKLLGIGKGLKHPEWRGRRPQKNKTLLIIHEQGLGDTILMSRFYPSLLESFARVVAQVQKPLAKLIATVDSRVEIVTDLEGVEYDTWCATMSLPHLLGIRSVTEIPNQPWLHVPPPEGGKTGFKIGLNWAGNPSFAYDYLRSTRLATLELLLKVPGVEWCSLHRGVLEHEAEAYGLPQPLRDAADFYDTARVIRGCDLVISTETAVPNLSAALGVPTCVLASPDADWRWNSWFQGVTLCRQETPGNWGPALVGALEVIRADLITAA